MKEKLEIAEKYVIVAIIIVLSYFVGTYKGENEGLREQDSKTITELRQTAKSYQIQCAKLQQVIGNTARRDSTANIILQQEINKANGSK